MAQPPLESIAKGEKREEIKGKRERKKGGRKRRG